LDGFLDRSAKLVRGLATDGAIDDFSLAIDD
jgi:hypothetical protein